MIPRVSIMNNLMKSLSFYGAYETADIVKKCLQEDCAHIESFLDCSDEQDLLSLAKYSKTTLFHGFILYVLNENFNQYMRDYESGGYVTIQWVDYIISLLCEYQIDYQPLELSDDDIQADEIEIERAWSWLEIIDKSLDQLWLKLADEAFHVLFRDREVLQVFNSYVASTIHGCGDLLTKYKTRQGYFVRCKIPSWLRKAVFHRDQGRCVFCNKDLTGIYNTLSQTNYDHIVPLSNYGINDPTNIQLSCSVCNNKKSNKNSSTSTIYAKWW